MKHMPGSEAASEMSVFPGTLQVEARVVAILVSDPLVVVGVHVRRVRMSGHVPEVTMFRLTTLLFHLTALLLFHWALLLFRLAALLVWSGSLAANKRSRIAARNGRRAMRGDVPASYSGRARVRFPFAALSKNTDRENGEERRNCNTLLNTHRYHLLIRLRPGISCFAPSASATRDIMS
jgi:hypothetical protein